jgi:glycosyltransferase involved in cell wall biosynthesis
MEYVPLVTIIMPCFNEENHIVKTLSSLVDEWVLENGEVLIMDGRSTDQTRQKIEEFKKSLQFLKNKEMIEGAILNRFLKIIENPNRQQVFGLNRGIEEAQGEIIVRTDAHCVYPPSYVKSCVDLLLLKEKNGVANVGGVMDPIGFRPVQRAIALAMRNPLGVGNALFHLGTKSGFVDTVYLGTFRKQFLNEIGLYDTDLHTNEDAELNLRIIRAGKKIYLDHRLRVTYFPRDTLKALAHQYYKYGRGRAYTSWKHRTVTSWRQIIPPIFMLGLIASLISSLYNPLFLLFPSVYALTILMIALICRDSSHHERPGPGIGILMAGALAVMHISWGLGFNLKLSRLIFRRPKATSSPARIA